MSQDQQSRDALALRRLEVEIGKNRIHVYRNLLGQPYAFFDIVEEKLADTQPTLHLHLFHKDVRGWLTQFIWKAEGILLHERELDRLLQALAGLSLREKVDRVTDPALLDLLENEPTVAVIVEYMHAEKQTRKETTMESLWKTLRDFARERGLLVRGKNRFPGGANVLSRKLNRFENELKQFEIQFKMTRSNGCKVVLERLGDSTSQPSAEQSALNPTTDQGLPPADAKQSMLAKLADKRRQQTDPSSPT
jgi:hypothetical protein